jgi:hypothetical protein
MMTGFAQHQFRPEVKIPGCIPEKRSCREIAPRVWHEPIIEIK